LYFVYKYFLITVFYEYILWRLMLTYTHERISLPHANCRSSMFAKVDSPAGGIMYRDSSGYSENGLSTSSRRLSRVSRMHSGRRRWKRSKVLCVPTDHPVPLMWVAAAVLWH